MKASRAHRRFSAFAACATLLLAVPAATVAHSELERSTPADGATVPSPFGGPIVLEFSAPLADGSGADLVGPAGATVAAAAVDGADATMTFTLDAALEAGPYELRWTTVAVDTDVARGTIEFTVALAAVSPTPAPTPQLTSGPTASATAASEATALASSVPSATSSLAPSAGGDTSGGSADVVLPIIVALVLVAGGAAWFLTRRNHGSTSG